MEIPHNKSNYLEYLLTYDVTIFDKNNFFEVHFF